MLPFCLKALQKYVFQPKRQKKISIKKAHTANKTGNFKGMSKL
jgi:hypothetical protein